MYVNTAQTLPISLDVQISLSKAQVEARTKLDVLCVACENLGFLPDARRIRYYSTLAAVARDFGIGSEAYFAANAFFAQTPRAATLALGEVFLAPLPAQLVSGTFSAADITALKAIVSGNLKVSYNPGTGSVLQSLEGLDFSSIASIDDIPAILNAALGVNLTAAVKTLPGGTKVLTIKTVATGDDAFITYPVAGEVGTFVGALLKLTKAVGGAALAGYAPTGIAGELENIAAASKANKKFVYGWCLGGSLREVEIQAEAATWALGQKFAIMPLVTNDVNALNVAYDADLGSVVSATGNRRVRCLYHDDFQAYPDVSILAYMLHVNYDMADSTVTAKFKTLPGIETVSLSESEWIALQAKGYDSYTAVGNSSRTFRDGKTEDPAWYLDTVINFDNFLADLETEVFNVFLRNKKIPYTVEGQLMLIAPCREVGAKYVTNGTLADRQVVDTTSRSGFKIVDAVQIIPTPIAQATSAMRAGRIAPPIQMILQEAGAMHEIALNVEIVG